MTIVEGWDSHAWIDGLWIHRAPRRPEVRPRLLAEATLLPWLAPQLPLPVPVPELTTEGVRHLLLPGEPFTDGGIDTGRALGAFLKALHAVDTAEAVTYGALDAATAAAEKTGFLGECRDQIVPLLPAEVRTTALELLDRVANVRTALIHCDLVIAAYEPTPDLVERSHDWARLSPWYGVHRGLLLDRPADVRTGLRDILSAL